MIRSAGYLSQKREAEELKTVFRDSAARAGDEIWSWFFSADYQKLKDMLSAQDSLDLSCVDVTASQGLACASDLRKKYKEMKLMVVADDTVSPDQYLKPSIMPVSLLLKPYTREQARCVVREFIDSALRLQNESADRVFVLETKQERTFIPMADILFFEACQKKVRIRVKTQEYETYDTIEHLESSLPKEFVRCHRGFIINRTRIDSVLLSKNLIRMMDGSLVPVSRTYRKKVKTL